MCYNAVDRHVESGRGDQPAIIYDSPVTGTKQIITFGELRDQVNVILKSRLWTHFDKKRSAIINILY